MDFQRLQTAAVCGIFAAAAATAENQRVEIIHVDDNKKASVIWVDPDGPGGKASGCVDEAIGKMDCVAVEAGEIGQYIPH